MDNFNLRYLKPSGFITLCVLLGVSLFAANKFINTHWGISVSVFAVVAGIFGLINKYLWNIKPFSFLYSVPDFSGRYEGTLLYQYVDDKCQTITEKVNHTKIIAQNGSDVAITSWTKTKEGETSSKSLSIEASIFKEKDGTFSLIYNYINEGNFELNFCPHYGTEVLKLVENGEGKHLVGKYYTERMPFQTKGKIDLKFISKNLYHEK